jgi:capsular polysaccharide biosynthesis protein/GGDEF domain-containing protein
MELKRYFRIMRRHWLIMLFTFAVVVGATVYFVLPQPWIYESSTTLQIAPSSKILNAGDQARVQAALSVEVAATYATQARGPIIRGKAVLGTVLNEAVNKIDLQLPAKQQVLAADVDRVALSNSKVGAEAQTATFGVTITVDGKDPIATAVLAQSIADVMVADSTGSDPLFLSYELQQLDSPTIPTHPVGPKKNLTIALGVILGFFLGLCLALLAEYLRGPADLAEGGSIVDTQTGAYNEEYLRQRLREEMARSQRLGHSFSFGVMKVALRTGETGEVSHIPATQDLRRVAQALKLTVPEEGLVSYLGGGTFASILPEISRPEAEGMLLGWEAAATALLDSSQRGEGANIRLSSGVCVYQEGSFVGNREAKRIAAGMTDVSATASADAEVVDLSGNGTHRSGVNGGGYADPSRTSPNGGEMQGRRRSRRGSRTGGRPT